MPTTSIIVDLEATCCNDSSFPRYQMEIIEIDAVAVDSDTGEFDSEYQTFIRPVRNPILTDFCKDLTSITQDQVDTADDYPTAMKPFREWLASLGDYDFCSWGDYDRKQFEKGFNRQNRHFLSFRDTLEAVIFLASAVEIPPSNLRPEHNYPLRLRHAPQPDSRP